MSPSLFDLIFDIFSRPQNGVMLLRSFRIVPSIFVPSSLKCGFVAIGRKIYRPSSLRTKKYRRNILNIGFEPNFQVINNPRKRISKQNIQQKSRICVTGSLNCIFFQILIFRWLYSLDFDLWQQQQLQNMDAFRRQEEMKFHLKKDLKKCMISKNVLFLPLPSSHCQRTEWWIQTGLWSTRQKILR